jgi:antitoxin MazE
MQTTIQKWGNSQGIRIPKDVLIQGKFKEGDVCEILVENDSIVLRPKKISKVSIKELFKDYSGKNPEEISWGKPQGNEEW